MRIHGTLTRWNDDRGFGFIAPASGAPDVFVHISEFPREGGRPRLNELISFEVVPGPDGKQRAVRVMRPGQKTGQSAAASQQPPSRWAVGLAAFVAVVAIGAYGFSRWTRKPVEPEYVTVPRPAAQPASPSRYSCDGRTMCSQMSSCAEATYFIRNCPNTQMDGDNDGRPCESQWCN